MSKVVIPYNNDKSSKREQVEKMFDNISSKYDFLNHFLSFGIDKLWRRRTIKMLGRYKPETILDVATGTGDFAISALRINPKKITGIDISEGMLNVGRDKIKTKGLENVIELMQADSEDLPFNNEQFNAVTVAFGVRNFQNLEKGLGEMHRVLKPNGYVAILEFSKPKYFPVKQLYWFYSKQILPFLGRIISKDRSAYTYLPMSVEAFPSGKEFADVLTKVGFSNVKVVSLSFGISTIYIAEK
ncbi:MAG: bifunctional demethylmenaquinone methyltransferase/2-methoxy-6-polyprenyl-1,4-benzoquinol methylase UbiE [Bacteroidales bacterium]|jgi:demethylmenaquinone methyltransferase/2-methoxy-6-polyprenyl-1,4-benzoquinol methylase|nr:bifunctional demethylmenaquinone methyltransferase/2-methoxy-6-polyprenyl-1,4-benzoquinol methylase UbiE [Bacteroidales bacterium]